MPQPFHKIPAEFHYNLADFLSTLSDKMKKEIQKASYAND